MRRLLWRARWFLGGCLAAYALLQFAQGMVLWKIAEWLQQEPGETRP